MNRLLMVDDDADLRDSFLQFFQLQGFEVALASNEKGVLEQIEEYRPQLVFLDLDLDGDGQNFAGAKLLKDIRKRWDQKTLPVIVISGAGNPKLMKEVLEEGADDYEVKPIKELKLLAEKAKRYILNNQEINPGYQPPVGAMPPDGKSPEIMNMTKEIIRAAKQGQDLLLLGETGSGKDVAAKFYHDCSRRKNKAFCMIDCPSIPTELFESELFGWEKGAFAGATFTRKGKLEEANGGIVFFNEIGDLPLHQQAKLLVLLESKTVTRLGSNNPVKLDVIILAATSRDLKKMSDEKQFRNDLFYRLSKNIIFVPSLRERPQDIDSLVRRSIPELNIAYGKNVADIEPEALSFLQKQIWPGNIRELNDCMRFGVKNCMGNRLGLDAIQPFFNRFGDHTENETEQRENIATDWAEYKKYADGYSDELKRKYLVHHLEKNSWNVTQTGLEIKISREYLNQLMNQYDIARPNKRD